MRSKPYREGAGLSPIKLEPQPRGDQGGLLREIMGLVLNYGKVMGTSKKNYVSTAQSQTRVKL